MHTCDRTLDAASASTLLNANLIFVNLPAGFHKSKPPFAALSRLWTAENVYRPMRREGGEGGGGETRELPYSVNIRSTSSFLKIDSSLLLILPGWRRHFLAAQTAFLAPPRVPRMRSLRLFFRRPPIRSIRKKRWRNLFISISFDNYFSFFRIKF